MQCFDSAPTPLAAIGRKGLAQVFAGAMVVMRRRSCRAVSFFLSLMKISNAIQICENLDKFIEDSKIIFGAVEPNFLPMCIEALAKSYGFNYTPATIENLLTEIEGDDKK